MTKIEKLREETYKEACNILDEYGKCAIIRPTGFGKTGILTKFIKSGKYKKILYLYPTEVIKNTVLNFYYGNNKKDSIDNVIFMTYMALTNLSESTLNSLEGVDLIICDECHRLGATETMEGMKDLLSITPTPHILGATATPERMDMIDEIALFFDDHVTSRYTLHDAFTDGILKKPFYTFCAFGESDPKVLNRIKKDAMLETKYMTNEERQYATELINARMIEISNLAKMEYVIKETIKETNTDTTYQKYIVFFSDFAHMRKAKKNVKKWFSIAFPTHKINELIISSETEEYRKNVNKLDTMIYKKNRIDLIYTCEMLNMGYHVNDLTGIMMYRGTYSSIIYAQQLGRVLSSGDTKQKIVFDIVDNIHRKSLYSTLGKNTTNQYLTEEEVLEYKELVNRTHDKDETGRPINLTAEETNRLIKLSKLMKKKKDDALGKTNCNILYQEDLIVTKYAATYKEIIAKTVAEPVVMRCKQAWARWIEKGGDASILSRDYILAQVAPKGVPLEPFCKLKHVTVDKVLEVMGIE
ncbi:MAG: DEAD/DEAH box helicase family protein [Bacilli bacterium]|nr:DEAD/DEAH box helicase family protein [Bacilli bacterium]